MPTSASSEDLLANISRFISDIAVNPWFILLGFILTVLGTILAVVFYYKSKGIKKISFATRSSNIVSDMSSRISNVEVYFKGNKVNTITITKLAFWNSGNSTINDVDVPRMEPLGFIFPSEIMDVQLESVTDKANQISIVKSLENEVLLKFEYLAKGDGGVLSVIHTAKSGGKIIGKGKIKGFKAPSRVEGGRFISSSSRSIRIIRVFNRHLPIFTILFGSLLFILTFLPNNEVVSKATGLSAARWAAFTYMVLGFVLLLVSRSRVPKNLNINID